MQESLMRSKLVRIRSRSTSEAEPKREESRKSQSRRSEVPGQETAVRPHCYRERSAAGPSSRRHVGRRSPSREPRSGAVEQLARLAKLHPTYTLPSQEGGGATSKPEQDAHAIDGSECGYVHVYDHALPVPL